MRGPRGNALKLWPNLTAAALIALVMAFGLFWPAQDAHAGIGDEAVAAIKSAFSPPSGGCKVPAWATQWATVGNAGDSLLAPFQSADSNISDTANGIASGLMSNAKILGGILASAWLMWSTLRFIADGQDNFLSVFADTAVPAAITSAVLVNYTSIISGLQGIFASMLSGSTAGGGLSGEISSLGTNLLSGYAKSVLAEFNAVTCASFFDKLGVFVHSFIVCVLMLICILLTILALAELVGVMFTGSVLMGVGIAVGPYFIVTAVTPWTKNFFDKWVQFLMGAMFYKTLIAIVIALVNGVITATTNQTTSYTGLSTGFPLGNALAMVGLIWVMRHVFKSIPGMAGALIGGFKMNAPSMNKSIADTVKKVNDVMKWAEDREKAKEKKAANAAKDQAGGAKNGEGSGPTATKERGKFEQSNSRGGEDVSGGSGSAGARSSAGGQAGSGSGGAKFDTAGATDVGFKEVRGIPSGGGAGAE